MATTPPNMFPHGSNYSYCIVVGGHEGNKPSDESGTISVMDVTKHHPSISPKDMPFLTLLRSPTQAELETTPFGAEPGTCVVTSSTTGGPTDRTIIGMPNELFQTQAMAGNGPLDQILNIVAAFLTGKRMPPKNAPEKNDRGAVVREKQETGGEWSHDKAFGLATHAAWYPLAGMVLPQVKQIDTAIQQFANIPGLDVLSQLPGSIMNLSSLFSKLTQKQKQKATQNLPPMTITGLENMMNLMSEVTPGGSYVSSGRIHEETFIENMVELLSQATTMSDVIEIIQRLRYDTTLHGLDKLANVEFKANTAYGQITQTMDINGNISTNQKSAEMIQKGIQALVGLMSSSQSGAPGKFLFGEANKLMSQAFSYLPPGIREQVVSRVATLSESRKHNEWHRRTIGKSNPFPLKLIGL